MSKLRNILLTLLLSVSVLATQFLGSTQSFADSLAESSGNYDFLSEDIQYLPFDPSTVIDLDENPNYIEEESGAKANCNYTSYSQTSTKGSKILLVGTNSGFGYCHIKERHLKVTGMVDYSYNGASQFYGPYTAKGMMNLAMKVINGTPDLIPTKDPNRKVKILYNKFEMNNIEVYIHRGSNWAGYSNYDWIIVTAYPRFVGNSTFKQ